MSDLTLYHNALSSCSQKVRLVLGEKGLDFVSRDVNLLTGEQHDPEYVKLNPKHVVPTLVHEGHVLVESSLINEYVDERFPEPALKPADPAERHAMRLWVKRIDEQVHPAAAVVTYAIGGRAGQMMQPPEVREANLEKIPDPAARAARRSVLEHGVKAPEFATALGAFLALLDDMELALREEPWLSGEGFGLADAAALPYVLRLVQMAMGPLVDPAVRPRVADWLARVEARPTYPEAVTKWVPDVVLGVLRTQGEAVWADVEPLTR